MLKHYYNSPKKRAMSQNAESANVSEEEQNDNSRATTPCKQEEKSIPMKSASSSIVSWISTKAHHQRQSIPWVRNSSMHGSKESIEENLLRKRPPSGVSAFTSNAIGGICGGNAGRDTDNNASVRRWNSFHSTRGECHPNKFRRERKSDSPSLEQERKRYQDSFDLPSHAKIYELRRGKSFGAAHKASLSNISTDLPLSSTSFPATNSSSQYQDKNGGNNSSDGVSEKDGTTSFCINEGNNDSVFRTEDSFSLEPSKMINANQEELYLEQALETQDYLNTHVNNDESGSFAILSSTISSLITTVTTQNIKEPSLSGGLMNMEHHHQQRLQNFQQQPQNQPPPILPIQPQQLQIHQQNRNLRQPPQTLGSVNLLFDENNFTGSNRPELYQKCNRGSHSSDTSSAYSGSDTMTSVHSSSLDADEVDLSGLVESVVDSDEEDLAESMDSLAVRDTVRECLEKDPSDRTEEDIETLLDFTKNLQAFTNMTLAVRRALCSVMVFAVVEKGGTMVMNDGEELDSWSVLINGHVEIEHSNGEKEELQVGDSFGILPTMDTLYHRGVMRTKCDDCQFVCITQTDYYRIQHQGEENTKRHEENGQLVMVTELRQGGIDGGVRRGHVVIRGTPERLMLQLIEENSMTDPTYVEDFLLTQRTFFPCSQVVAKQLIQWFENESTAPYQSAATPTEITDRVTRVILLWVNNHFTDFETDPQMMKYLEIFEAGLEKKSMLGQLHLLHIACAAKARTRVVTLARSSRDEDLHFDIVGGYEKGGFGIFVSKVEKKTKAEDVGLKRGDQILEVNGNSFEHMKLARALELMTSTTHLCITVKSNLLAFKEMLQTPDNDSPRPRASRRTINSSDLVKLQSTTNPRVRLSSADLISTTVLSSRDQADCASASKRDNAVSSTIPSLPTATASVTSTSTTSSKGSGGFMTLASKRKLQKALIKMNLYPKNSGSSLLLDTDDQETNSASSSPISTTSPPNEVLSSNNPSTGSAAKTPMGSISSNSSISTSTISSQTINSATTPNNTNKNSNSASGNNQTLYHSHSNPDLTTIYYEDLRASDYPEHVLKVYKSDQSCKYLLVHKETTAHEVVMLALQEFGIHETSSNFSLCEVSVGDGGMIKQRRLPDQLQNLAERIGLSARYYLKTNGITETLVPDDLAPELVRESVVHFLQLNPNEVAIQLTVQDFAIFRQIESTEYIDDLFEIQSKYGVPMLTQFSELVNREMFWVVTEICSEYNMVRRMKIIKQFIKIARHCKECQNFNSMFAILSGLGHAAVSRLRLTWEKLPSKYQKLFNDLQDIMDPSRNMSKYRQLLLTELNEQHPVIPFYPVVKKDLTFIHLGNDTYVESLINFEKLRMIAKEIRNLTHMCSSPYDLLTILELKGQPPSSAMVALNQMSMNTGGNSSSLANSNHYYVQHSHPNSGSLAPSLGALSSNASGQATVKRRKKSAAAPNPKKMFEEAQMVRRVKAYLKNIKVITDEDSLHQLSLECEQSGGSAPNTVTIRKRHPSPTLSTTSSTSSTSEGKKGQMIANASGIGGPPKFGAASPQAVKKILSLSEPTKARPHQPRHLGGAMLHFGTSNVANATSGNPALSACSIGTPQIHSHPQHHVHTPPNSLLSHHLHHPGGASGLPPTIQHSSSLSPSPSPGAHRRMGSSSSAGSVSYSTYNYSLGGQSSNNSVSNSARNVASSSGNIVGRAVHERSHSDGTPAPLPSVDLSVESSSVTSLSNLSLRKTITSGSVTSNDSGHGSYIPTSGVDSQSNFCDNLNGVGCSGTTGGSNSDSGDIDINVGHYHVACSIVHNPPTSSLHQQRRHSAKLMQHTQQHHCHGLMANLSAPSSSLLQQQLAKGNTRIPPPAYSVAAHRAILHRLGRAHSHEGVTTGVTTSMGVPTVPPSYYSKNSGLLTNTNSNLNTEYDVDDNDDDGAQVSAV